MAGCLAGLAFFFGLSKEAESDIEGLRCTAVFKNSSSASAGASSHPMGVGKRPVVVVVVVDRCCRAVRTNRGLEGSLQGAVFFLLQA